MSAPRSTPRRRRRWEGTMASGMEGGGIGFVVASYVITWVVLGVMLVRTVGSVRRARAEYDQAAKGEFRT